MQKRHFFKDALVVTQPSRHRRWEIGRNFPSDFPFSFSTHTTRMCPWKRRFEIFLLFIPPPHALTIPPNTGWKSIWPETPREYCSWASGRDRAEGKEGHRHTNGGLCCQTTQPGGVENFQKSWGSIRAKNHSFLIKKYVSSLYLKEISLRQKNKKK